MTIRTEHNGFEWSAIDDNIYDGAEDAGPQCIGHGRTEEEAIADLMDQIEDSQA